MEVTIGKRIKQAIEAKGLKQSELADKVHITQTTLSQYINDQRTPDAMTLLAICKALDVSPEWVLGLRDDEQTHDVKASDNSFFDYAQFLKDHCNYETQISESVTSSIMGKLYAVAFDDGFKTGYVKGFTQAKEAYNKGAANEQ